MTNMNSPYEELVKKVEKIDNELELINKFVRQSTNTILILSNELEKIKRKLDPENPGDINHLYQNWDKN